MPFSCLFSYEAPAAWRHVRAAIPALSWAHDTINQGFAAIVESFANPHASVSGTCCKSVAKSRIWRALATISRPRNESFSSPITAYAAVRGRSPGAELHYGVRCIADELRVLILETAPRQQEDAVPGEKT